MMTSDAVIGIDLGTTMSKALVCTCDGRQLAVVRSRTPWETTADGGTEVDAESFVRLTVDLLCSAVARATGAGPLTILAVSIAGLAESGVVVDGSGLPQTPAIAWFDRRGTQQVEAARGRDGAFASEFVRRTGLPFDCQASVAKLLWFLDSGLRLRPEHRWLSVPEYVVHRLGGDLVCEPSLASRTGLLDQATGSVWTDGARHLGLPPGLLPDLQPYGQSVGALRIAGVPPGLHGAALIVGGHDHAVATLGVGASGDDELFNSAGTADVVVRSVPGTLGDSDREKLVGQGVSAGRHVLPSTTSLIGGVRGGLVLRRVLGLLGIRTETQRDELDRAAVAVTDLPPGLEVAGAGPTGDDVVLRVRDDTDPATVWAATTRYTARQTLALLDLMETVAGTHAHAVASGGWIRMASVRAAKSAVIDHLTFSDVVEPGAAGAALLARQAVATT